MESVAVAGAVVGNLLSVKQREGWSISGECWERRGEGGGGRGIG